MSINEEELKKWIEQVTKKLAHLEANQIAIINGDFCDANTEPKEPLIKDKKIRKVVRLCADIWKADKILVIKSGSRIEFSDGSPNMRYVSFIYAGWQDKIKDRTYYTIPELCGEAEAPEPIEPTFIDLDERIKEKSRHREALRWRERHASQRGGRMSRKIHGVKMRCPHCNKYFEVIMPTPPSLVESQTEEDE